MKITKLVSQSIGTGISAFSPTKAEWVVSAISAGVGLASSLLGGAASERAAEEAARQQRIQKNKDDASYLRRMNENYADTAAGQSLINRAREAAQAQWKRADGAAAVAGGTDAAAAMAKQQGNDMIANTIDKMAANDTARQDKAAEEKQASDKQYAAMEAQRAQQRADNVAKTAGAAANAIGTLAGAFEQPNNNATNLAGSNNASKVVETPAPVTNPVITTQSGITGTADEWRKAIQG